VIEAIKEQTDAKFEGLETASLACENNQRMLLGRGVGT
jgi:hypothetical protein